jgi:hypothetical protein
MQKAQVQFLCRGIAIRKPRREKRRNALPGRGFPPGPLENGGKTPPPDQGRFWHANEGIGYQGRESAGELGPCQEPNAVYPFNSLMPVTQRKAVRLAISVQGPITDAQEHGSPRFVVMSRRLFAFPQTLVERGLFGHLRGAFIGALRKAVGSWAGYDLDRETY